METCSRNNKESAGEAAEDFAISLGRMAFDLASLKNSKAPAEEILALENMWRELLGEYGERPAEKGVRPPD